MSQGESNLLRRCRRNPGRSVLALGFSALLVFGAIEAGLYGRALYHFRAAARANERHRLREARQHLDVCLGAWPRSAPVHFLAAQVARRAGAYDDAERHLDACEDLQGGRTDATGLERVLLSAQGGDLPPDTESYLRSLAERDTPEAPLIAEALGAAYLEILRAAAAEEVLSRCLSRQPDDIPALVLRGRARQRLNDVEVLDDYRRALELDPDDADTRLRLAGALFAFGRGDEAVAQYELLSRQRPDDPAVRLGLARCRYQAGRLGEARQLLGALVAERPHDRDALRELGRLEVEAGHGAEAEPRLRQAVALDPSDRDAQHLLTQALRAQGKEDEARRQQERSARVLADLTRIGQILRVELPARPRDPALCCELGTLYLQYGKRALGARWLHRALECDPNYAPARQALARAAAVGPPPQGGP